MDHDTQSFIARLKRIADELHQAESDLRAQRTRIREALTMLRLGERPTVVAALLDREDVWAVEAAQ